MPELISGPPITKAEPVTEILHGAPITDPYRWLEEQNSLRTRQWIEEQTRYARAHLDGIPERERIRDRVRELLDVETCDAFLKRGSRYFFRKRLAREEQPSLYFREGPEGKDELLVDPAARGTGIYTAVKPLDVSADGNLLLYEVKQGGERRGTFEIVDVRTRTVLPDILPHGYLRGFAFAPDAKSFYYVHEATRAERPFCHAAHHHVLETPFEEDREIFSAGEGEKLRFVIIPGPDRLGLLVYRFLDKTNTDFHAWTMGSTTPPIPIVLNADYRLVPRFLGTRILAETDQDAPNRRIVEVQPRKDAQPLLLDLVREGDAQIRNWVITANHIVVSYARGATTETKVFDVFGKHLGRIPCQRGETVRVVCGGTEDDEILIERESFVRPIEIDRCCLPSRACIAWARRRVPLDAAQFGHSEITFPSKDGTAIPMFLVGRRDRLAGGPHPVFMTSYGGYGIPMTPQFSVFVAFLIESGCLFALPNIRGGSEFGAEWHNAAKRRNRRVAFDDFLAAAEWLVDKGKTTPSQLAIFGGSNSGLLVAAAMTQRPELFRAVLCMAPITDMLRYHLFDDAHVWKDEYGTAEDIDDFRTLASYSPYHRITNNTDYPATMIVSGDADQNCNALHARKMTARLQAATSPDRPVILDYSEARGHSPVLPLTARVSALTDRLAFLCRELGLTA